MSDLERLATDPTSALLLAMLAALGVLIVLHLRLRARVERVMMQYGRLVRGGGGANMEALLERNLELGEVAASRVEELDAAQTQLREAMARTIQRVGMVRFNPFEDTGGDQSFSIALLDGTGDGLVVSSFFSRSGGSRVFAKPIQGGQSKYNLSEEEEQAIQLANEAAEPAHSR